MSSSSQHVDIKRDNVILGSICQWPDVEIIDKIQYVRFITVQSKIDFDNLNEFSFGEPIDGFGSQRSTRSFNSLPALKAKLRGMQRFFQDWNITD
jgi:hypothetical protein